MKSFHQYLAMTERSYSYRIKTVVAIDDALTTAIENAIVKYDPFDISITKTIFQDHPLDFGNVPPSEVYIIDVTLGLPASQLALRMEICAAIGAPDKFVVVRGANDPIENETQRLAAANLIAAEAEKAGLTPEALLNDPAYQEAEEFVSTDMYGDAYNSKFVAYLKKVSDERKAADAARVVVPKNPMFDFLAPMAEPMGDTEGLATDREVKGGDNPMNDHRSIQGNYDGDKKTFKKVYRTKKGDTKVVSKDANGVRKGA